MIGLNIQYKKSYSQCGEDLIVNRILNIMGIEKPTYLDVGVHDPITLNNTYIFYKKGCFGVNVEPNPDLFKKIQKKRRRDISLNVGVAAREGVLDFYVMNSSTLNTFCKETAERYLSYGNQKIERALKIKVLNINDIIDRYFDSKPNFVSLDVEGLEMEILKSFNFEKYRPEVFCIETLTYTEDNSEIKLTNIIDFMQTVGYMVNSDTYVNTIFVDKMAFKNRGR